MSTDAPTISVPSRASDRAVALWLIAVTGMVAAMIVIGGITRLTESGLSMVEWRPLVGWLPPLTDGEWQRVFDLYRQTSEYQLANAWMGLEDFKAIFWWEYIHRVWGRLIGVVFAVPFLMLAASGRIRRALYPRLILLFLLGGLQGAIGWWMVTSGFVDRTDVSQYRLATHLSVAFVILGALLWTVLDLTRQLTAQPAGENRRGGANLLLALVSITVVAGAFVAGLDAGLVYNEFPLMGGGIVPPEYGTMSPFWIDAFENPPTVQFHHRVLAVTTVVAALLFSIRARRSDTPPMVRRAAIAVAHLALLQAAVGVMTLLAQVPVALGALHQAGAVALFGCTVWLVWETRR